MRRWPHTARTDSSSIAPLESPTSPSTNISRLCHSTTSLTIASAIFTGLLLPLSYYSYVTRVISLLSALDTGTLLIIGAVLLRTDSKSIVITSDPSDHFTSERRTASFPPRCYPTRSRPVLCKAHLPSGFSLLLHTDEIIGASYAWKICRIIRPTAPATLAERRRNPEKKKKKKKKKAQ